MMQDFYSIHFSDCHFVCILCLVSSLDKNLEGGPAFRVANTCTRKKNVEFQAIISENELPFELGMEGAVTVRGGLYEVNVKQRLGQSIYWRGELSVLSRFD